MNSSIQRRYEKKNRYFNCVHLELIQENSVIHCNEKIFSRRWLYSDYIYQIIYGVYSSILYAHYSHITIFITIEINKLMSTIVGVL